MLLKQKPKIDAAARRQQMLTAPIGKLVAAMAFPSTMNRIIGIVYGLVDTYFVAQISTSAAAAVGVCCTINNIVSGLVDSFGVGSKSIISRRLGAGDTRSAHTFASSTTFACVLLGVLITSLGLLFLQPLLRFLGASDTMMPHAIPYARLLLLGIVFYCCNSAMSSALNAQGQVGYGAFSYTAAIFLNAFLDYLFVIKLSMGAGGAALATTLSRMLTFSILLSAFLRKKSIVKIRIKYISLKFRTYFEIIHTGLPTLFRQGSASVASTILYRMAGPFGDAAVAAISIANKIYSLCRNIVLGIGAGYQIVVGYNYGAGKKKRVKQSFSFATLAGTVFCLLCAAIMFFFPEGLIGLFRKDPDVVSVGAQMLRIMVFSMPLLAFSTFVNQTYQCLGFSLWATLLACCRQGILFIPCLYVLHHFFGLTGITMTQAAADILTALVSIPFLFYFFRKLLNKKEALL